ncbi:hypothetical protein GALMADRAFT_68503 [Galerina marginata CBS 339.88]|uniref:Mechanosensitive ion channel protein n=1 Tax=Galerina marginata (strain CBS 339.88) TaxID=685588 RepID=A0A067T0P6_GALM3|nr:hypothetical protein GALMADRAFT_68503 [Galerina marginata CBS 339.88]
MGDSSGSYASAPISLAPFSAPSTPSGTPYDPASGTHTPAHNNGTGKLHRPSWANLRKDTEQGYSELDDSRGYSASQSDLLRLPDGEVPKTKVGKLYSYLISVSIITRWILFIVPILGILWIPGILSLTAFPNAQVWGVKLIWWSIWLSVIWGGWWVALAAARIAPGIIRATVGVVAVSTRRYIDWMQALHRYIALFAWTVAVWVSYNPVIDSRQAANASPKSVQAIKFINKLFFGFLICAGILLFEKFSIQWIAGKFHERSYAERIADQKYAVRTLVALYRNSIDIPGRSDTLGYNHLKESAVNPMRLLKKFREGVRYATTTTATVFGNVASEIAGSSVLQPNSPQAVIKTALESANKSRLLARRLFYSFVRNKSEFLTVEDMERFFPTKEEAIQAFTLFDRDGNGDTSREEMEMACLEFHREQLSIEHSMRDLDSAVGRLDNIFMSIYVIIAALVIAVTLETQVAALITGAGTLVLGLSWLIGGSLQEVLTSIIFLFVKHPFDVGDRVVVSGQTYTVKEIRLLSTVFLDSNSTLVQAPNNQLNTLMSETFTFDVSYSTTFEDLERLREKMLAFVKAERRDYQPIFDVTVKDFPEQAKMTLSADIKYKSNGQQAGLKAKRRNKWICALKAILAEVKIHGPSGDPNPPPAVSRYAQVPWELIEAEDRKKANQKPSQPAEDQLPPSGGWKLDDKNAAIRTSSLPSFLPYFLISAINDCRTATIRLRSFASNLP